VVEGDDVEVPEDVEAAELELPPPPQAVIKANRHEAADIMRNLRMRVLYRMSEIVTPLGMALGI
jgi:hypothetical protein